MNEKLTNYLNSVFAPYDGVKSAAELKADLLSDLQERFNELKAEGKDDETAFEMTIDSIGDIEQTVREVAGLSLSLAGVLSWLTVAGILALFTLALTWIAVIAGLSAKSVDGAGAFSYPIIFLPFISSAFVPTETMPPGVRAFAENQPVTSIVEAIRFLLAGQPVSNDIWVALAWCLGILIAAYAFAMRAYKRKTA
jgi:ABC-2 type transport system permease protein